MSRQTVQKQWTAALGGLSWPLLLGAATTSVFYVLLHEGPLKTPFMYRYFASHSVLYFETGLFFIGLSALLIKLSDTVRQTAALSQLQLPAAHQLPLAVHCERCVTYLTGLSKSMRESYLAQRFEKVIEFVSRKGSSDGLDEELKYLAKQDAVHQKESYSLVRIVAWATPGLGLLGTVIGMTHALGDLDPKLFTTDLNAAMKGLFSGLYIAFDATALALVLSMTLMFVKFFADRIESQLLAGVDTLVRAEAATRFPTDSRTENPYLKTVEKMSNAVIKTTETLIRQQTEQWQAAMSESNQQLGRIAQTTGEQVRMAIGESLNHSLKGHAERLARFEFEADQQMRARWDQWQSAIADNVRVVRDQQSEVAKQTELIAKIAQATSDVAGLERSLNQNLSALAGSKNFEETVLSLSAAIQLLSVKLTHLPDRATAVDLRSSQQGKAA